MISVVSEPMGQSATVGGHEVIVYTEVVVRVDVSEPAASRMTVRSGSVQDDVGSGERVTTSGVDENGGLLPMRMVEF